MNKILRTDNAYEAIDKINGNFAQLFGGVEPVVAEGSISGNDDTVVNAYVSGLIPGDYVRIYFPDGDWPTLHQRNDNNKFFFGYRDSGDNRHNLSDAVREAWGVPSYGYDIYIPDGIVDYKDLYLSFRALAGAEVRYVITRLDKSTVKEYFVAEMATTVDTVRSLQSDDSATIAVCTDIHYRDTYEQYRPFAPFAVHSMTRCMAELARRIRLDNVVCLGDSVDGLWSAEITRRDARDIARSFADIKAPVLYALGNHDDNRYYSKNGGDRSLTGREMFAEYIQQVDDRKKADGSMSGCNYYRDNDAQKIRYIVVTAISFSREYRFTAETQQFFENCFDTMPVGYKAVVFSHTPFLAAMAYESSYFYGGSQMSDIVTANIDKFAVMFFGHTHFDNFYVSPYLCVNIGAAKVYNTESGTPGATAPEGAYFACRAVGDERENLWDAVVINTADKMVSCVRFGAGPDRHLHTDTVKLTAGGTTTLSPSVVTPDAWEVRESESEYVTVVNGTVTLSPDVTSGSRLMVMAKDTAGNMEVWTIEATGTNDYADM